MQSSPMTRRDLHTGVRPLLVDWFTGCKRRCVCRFGSSVEPVNSGIEGEFTSSYQVCGFPTTMFSWLLWFQVFAYWSITSSLRCSPMVSQGLTVEVISGHLVCVNGCLSLYVCHCCCVSLLVCPFVLKNTHGRFKRTLFNRTLET